MHVLNLVHSFITNDKKEQKNKTNKKKLVIKMLKGIHPSSDEKC